MYRFVHDFLNGGHDFHVRDLYFFGCCIVREFLGLSLTKEITFTDMTFYVDL